MVDPNSEEDARDQGGTEKGDQRPAETFAVNQAGNKAFPVLSSQLNLDALARSSWSPLLSNSGQERPAAAGAPALRR